MLNLNPLWIRSIKGSKVLTSIITTSDERIPHLALRTHYTLSSKCRVFYSFPGAEDSYQVHFLYNRIFIIMEQTF